ncbi:MAG: S41 family peptidase [Filifactoraceae bacterium]
MKFKDNLVAKQVFVFLLGVAVPILYFTDFGTSNFIPKSSYRQYQQIEKMANTIEEKYYKEVDKSKLYEKMKYSIFSDLEDGYSYYMEPELYKAVTNNSEGRFYGYGLGNILYKEDEILIGDVMDKSPAEKVGILPNDKIVELNGESIKGLGENTVKEIFKDNKNPTIKLGIKRDGKQEVIYFTLTKENIEDKSVSLEIVGDTGYISISHFIETTGNDFNKQVDDALKKGVKSFILDFRNNGGGLLDEAVKVADRILPKGTITYTKDRFGKEEFFKSTDKESLDFPMVVLVNKQSASASELVTIALRDNKKVKIIGEKTFGKGIVQETYSLRDGSGFKITTKEYFSPSGINIHKVGIVPDIIVSQGENIKLGTEEDIQLKRAIEYISTVK